jgi:hypothetical protein
MSDLIYLSAVDVFARIAAQRQAAIDAARKRAAKEQSK